MATKVHQKNQTNDVKSRRLHQHAKESKLNETNTKI